MSSILLRNGLRPRVARAAAGFVGALGLAAMAASSGNSIAGDPTVEFTVAAQSQDEAVAAGIVTLTLSAIHTLDVTVPFSVAGSAASPDDFTHSASPAIIPAGSMTVDIDVTLVDDLLDEDDEMIVFSMGTPTNGLPGVITQHTFTITDDDLEPTVDFMPAAQSVSEGAGGASITMLLSAVSGRDVSVTYTLNGSATEIDDYTVDPGPLVIPAGSLSIPVNFVIVGDSLPEPDEVARIAMDTITNGTVGAITAHWLTILDDDTVLPTVEWTGTAQDIAEAGPLGTATLQLSATSASDVTVPYTVSGTATDGVDFTFTPSPAIIPAGQLTADVQVTPSDDLLDEVDETIVLTIGAPSGANAGGIAVHTATIIDDDIEPTVSFRYRRAQVDEGDGAFPVVVVLSDVSGRDVSVPVLATGSATDLVDYTLPAGPLIIPAGQQSENLIVTIIDDTDDERNERLNLDFDAGIEGATPGAITNTMLVLIDNDEVTYEPTISGLRPSTQLLTFPDARVGEASSVQTVTLQNTTNVTVTLQDVLLEGDHALDFVHTFPIALPIVLEPGDSADVDVIFDSFDGGEREAALRVVQSPAGAPQTIVSLFGRAFGPTGAEILVNAGPDPFLDGTGQLWAADYGSTGTSVYISYPGEIEGTNEDPLYQTSRFGPSFGYSFALPNGFYEIVLHFVDPVMIQPGWRVFDVSAEGQVFVDDLDLFTTVGTRTAYVTAPYRVNLTDGVLDLDLLASQGDAIIAAVEVRSVPVVNALETSIAFGVVDQTADETRLLNLQNIGLHQGELTSITWDLDGTSLGTGDDFYVEIGGTRYYGGVSSVSHTVSLVLPGEVTTPITVGFSPTEHEVHQLSLILEGDFDEIIEVIVSGTGGADVGWGFLHPVLDAVPSAELVIDYDGDGSEEVQLFGAESHTHEPGHVLLGYEWREAGTVFSTDVDPLRTFPVGQTTIDLTISDDNAPPATATDNITISVFDPDMVPGILVTYFRDTGGGTQFLLDNVPLQGDFIERVEGTLGIDEQNGMIGGSPFTGGVMLRMEADFEVTQTVDMEFVPSGGAGHRIEIDGVPHTGPQQLSIGTHSLEVRFAVDVLGELPVFVEVFENGVLIQDYGVGLSHSVNGVVPVIHSMPGVGLDLGGNLISIKGFGFWPRDQVIVHWGATDFTYPAGDFVAWHGEEIQLISPPGSGSIQVTIETPGGTSFPRTFQYSPTGPVPVNWTTLPYVQLDEPTTAAWGPDGRLYVGQISGQITAYEFDEDYNVINGTPAGTGETYVGVSNLTNFDLCGLAFNPFDPALPVKIYVGHGQHFLNGGGGFEGVSPFTGGITVLTGPDFDTPTPLITQLPTSNHDHGVNGIVFDDNGDLLIAMGGNTNAGVKWPQIGDVPESPLSGAILRARTSLPAFTGDILYEATTTGNPIDDQVLGKHISVAQGDISVYAPGMRNAYDLTLTTWGHLYVTDNGPNGGYGPASTSATTHGGNPHPNTPDELLLVERGLYYGHPNRNRGRFDDRQNVYYDTLTPSEPSVFKQNIANVDSSTDGLCEYRATSFNDGVRGRLIAQKWNSVPRLIELSDDKREVVEITTSVSPQITGLDVLTGPGGAILAANFSNSRIEIAIPDDVSALTLTAYDIFPWHAPAGGGARFVIGGENFGTLLNTTVTIGGQPVTLTSVTSRRIVGTIPPSLTGGATDLLDVAVTVGADSRVIPAAFAYLPSAPGQAVGIWRDGVAMPIELGEVTGGVIGNKLYLFGEGSNLSYVYDLYSEFWSASPAPRPFPGNHHGAEVWGGKLYLFGGLSGGDGKVQIYDPQANIWSQGASMPWNGGSCNTALIGDLVYVSGGIVSNSTVSNLAVYDPALDQWSTNHPTLGAYPAMPTGVNHAASSTDGTRFYVFGGRSGGNFPQPGFDLVQVYDPATNTWDASNLGGSSLAPMPLPRGGTGKAVYDDGVFMILGGESDSAVFDDVQLYDPNANTWTTDAPMPTARHGVFPILFEARLYVPGGGTNPGFSASDVLEVLSR